MRHVLTLAPVILLIGCGTGIAQVAPTTGMGTSGMGVTSPVGTLSSDTSVGPTGIPMGATELNTVGVSPLYSTLPCPTTMTGTGMAAAGSTFDGGGTSSSAAASTGCGGSGTGSMATANTGGTTGLASGSNSAGIGLGATEVGTPGESAALPSVMVPSVSVAPGASPMLGTLPTAPGIDGTMSSMSGTSGMATGSTTTTTGTSATTGTSGMSSTARGITPIRR